MPIHHELVLPLFIANMYQLAALRTSMLDVANMLKEFSHVASLVSCFDTSLVLLYSVTYRKKNTSIFSSTPHGAGLSHRLYRAYSAPTSRAARPALPQTKLIIAINKIYHCRKQNLSLQYTKVLAANAEVRAADVKESATRERVVPARLKVADCRDDGLCQSTMLPLIQDEHVPGSVLVGMTPA